MGYSFQLAARDFHMHNPRERLVHTMGFVTPAVELWLEQKLTMCLPCGIDLTIHHSPSCQSTMELYFTP